MTQNRNFEEDRMRTLAMIREPQEPMAARNWLGHEVVSGAAKIDQLLLAGATWDELEKQRTSAREHIRHLEIDHGLRVIERDGKHMFDRHQSEAGSVSTEEQPQADK